MSVILGAIHFDGHAADANHMAAVASAYASLGFGGHRIWTQGPVGLMRWNRDGTSQSQHEILPRSIQDDHLAITAEARLDNRDELFEALSIPRSDQETMSDSTLILLAYQKWGEGCPEHLEGDFSFVLYDRQREALVCVQSVFPIQPLYYLQTGSCFAFGSMIRPLLSLARVPKKLNEEFFARYAGIAFMQPDADPAKRFETAFAGVSALPPATILVVERDGSTRRRTWWQPDPNREIRLASDQDYYDQVREVTIRAVHDRLRTDQRVVCLLSGGLDSSAIACIAARKLRERGERLTAISSVLPLDHPGPEKDEREFIDIVKHAEDLDVKYLHPGPSKIDDAETHLDWLESPGSSPKDYVYREFYEAAKACGAGVIMDGCGGEVGPTNHGFNLLPSLARQGQWSVVWHELNAMSRRTGRNPFGLFLREVIAPQFPGLKSLFRRLKNPLGPGEKVTLPLNRDFAREHGLSLQVRGGSPFQDRFSDPKQQTAVAVRLMQGGTRNQPGMAHGIPTLYPFFDRRIIDCCLAVPARLYQVDGWSRNLIRQSMHGILPPQIQWRSCKRPFSPDFYRRFQAELPAVR